MATEYGYVQGLKRELEDDYRMRHEAFRSLRRYWHGDYWRTAERDSASNITSIFRDLTHSFADVGPDVKLVHNVVQMVCVKYQTFLSPLPQIRMYADPPETDRKRAQATTKERYLYGCWTAADMAKKNTDVAWYLPLMGDVFHGIFPDFDLKLPTVLLRSPEYAFPVPDLSGDTSAFIFSWKVKESNVRRNYPDFSPAREKARMLGVFRKRGGEADPSIDLVEWSDDNEFIRWIDGQSVNGVEHKLGFNLFEHMKFIHVPDEVWGHGAVEQAINLNEMGNALYSLMFQSVVENVFPRLVLIDPAKAPEEIETGPGAVIPINAGGAVEWLHPPTQAIGMQEQFHRTNEQNIMESTGMNRVNFGESPATSIVTGKAVNELQGAGTGSTVEMVQGTGIGSGLESWNEKAIVIGQRLFAEEKINLFGIQPRTGYDLNPARFSMTLRGRDLVGGTRNEVIFQPAISQHEKLVMWLQAKGGGLVSNKYIRDQIGIADSDAMDQEMFNEAIDAGVLGMILQQFQAEPDPTKVEDVEGQAAAMLAGKVPSQPHPLVSQAPGPPSAAPPAAGQGAQNPPGGGGTPPIPPPQTAAPPSPNLLSLNAVAAVFQNMQGLQGQVFLVGELVQRGQTEQDVEVMITSQQDQDLIMQQLPGDLRQRIVIHLTDGEPNEPFLEVTPGKQQRRGGPGQANPQQLAGMFVH